MIHTDAVPITPQKTSPQIFFPKEEIILRPSTELIPDEYLHEDDNVAVHIFHLDDEMHQGMALNLRETFTGISPNVKQELNLHPFREREKFDKDLKTLKKQLLDKKALLLIFIGHFKSSNNDALMMETKNKEETLYEFVSIWSQFSANNCMELKNLPKIILFFTFPLRAKVQVDAAVFKHTVERGYDFPAESDMLIVLKQVDEDEKMVLFLEEFCNNIKEYSKKHDIIELLTNTPSHDQKSYPIIISTLTRKFYLTSSNNRQHYLSLMENHTDLNDIIGNVLASLKIFNDRKEMKSDSGSSKGAKLGPTKKPPQKGVPMKNVTKIAATSTDSTSKSKTLTLAKEDKSSMGKKDSTVKKAGVKTTLNPPRNRLRTKSSGGESTCDQRPPFRIY